MYEYRATVINVVDGDTIKVLVDLGFFVFIRKSLRLARINAPEMATIEGKTSKEYLTVLLPVNGKVVFKSKSLDRYGRSIAEVLLVDKNISDIMVDAGMAIYQKY